MKPHKHCELIKQWADGAEIQVRDIDSFWVNTKTPDWDESLIYRVKPKTLKFRLWIGKTDSIGEFVHSINSKSKDLDCELVESMQKINAFVRWHGDWQEVEV